MAIFNQKDLTSYTERIELQKEILPLSTVFTDDQKKEIDTIYKRLLIITSEAKAQFLEVIDPIIL